MKVEWDAKKSKENIKKHGISFDDAIDLFLGNHIQFELASSDEKRWAAIGKVGGKYYTAIFTKRASKIRLISVRRSRKDEEVYYGNYF